MATGTKPKRSRSVVQEDPAPTRELIRTTIRGCHRMIAAGYLDEVQRFVAELQEASGSAQPSPDAKNVLEQLQQLLSALEPVDATSLESVRGSIALRWMYSILAWEDYRVRGERAARASLPHKLWLDCAFFLRQRWVAELIAKWHQTPAIAEERINDLFFGPPRRGVRSYRVLLENRERDFRICCEVERLRNGGWRKPAVFAEVADRLKRLGIKEALSEEAIKSIYEKRRKGHYDPLVDRLEPRTRRVKRRAGLKHP